MFIGNYKISIFLFFLASVSDYLDGYLARKFEAESELGEILDPIADKILVVFLLIGLTIILDSFLIGVLSSFIISREILVTALRDYASRQGYSHKIKVTFLAKIKTSIQLFSIGLYLFALAISFNLLLVICDIFLMIATIITLYTGFEYYINIFKK
jgi:CDP-diacylglycerol--glycerol-3-phosphate 3-phosphatidyltransferase